ncbi:very long chain fatty acid elongase 6-like [Centruroides vittatus]|uniref:very long chain fatty acid elongase 6-like n=1 Tax=Centruroides vittatus TaxID=120091 RepID=UPI00350F5DB0
MRNRFKSVKHLHAQWRATGVNVSSRTACLKLKDLSFNCRVPKTKPSLTKSNDKRVSDGAERGSYWDKTTGITFSSVTNPCFVFPVVNKAHVYGEQPKWPLKGIDNCVFFWNVSCTDISRHLRDIYDTIAENLVEETFLFQQDGHPFILQSQRYHNMETVENSAPRGELKSLYVEEYLRQYVDNKWTQSFFPYSIPLSLAYVIIIFSLQTYMKSRPPFQLRWPLVIWNILLAAFSICGTLRLLPGLWILIREFGFMFSVCNLSFALKYHPLPLWMSLFTWSKLIEFGDTLFIVLRKRKVIFLHWYHHALTLISIWHVNSNESSSIYWCMTLNMFVHSFMYSYYAVTAMKVKVPVFIAMTITIMQIAQMFMGCFVNLLATYMYYSGKYCEQTNTTLLLLNFMCFSYAWLFCRFFRDSYLKRTNRSNLLHEKSQ